VGRIAAREGSKLSSSSCELLRLGQEGGSSRPPAPRSLLACSATVALLALRGSARLRSRACTPDPAAALIPVHQRTATDCLRAAVASILELPIERVPDFYRGDGLGPQISRLADFLSPLGLDPCLADPERWRVYGVRWWIGIANNGEKAHALVMDGGEIAFNPSRTARTWDVRDGLFLFKSVSRDWEI
jgi:hypothetical protein